MIIKSFTVNHLELLPGLYVSRKDFSGESCVTTFDMRITRPNVAPPMDTGAAHAFEHLGATYLRNCEIKDRVVYFGPMGCRTGFYIVLFGDLSPIDFLPHLEGMLSFIESAQKVPGASAKECGNYLDLNLPAAKYYARAYREEVLPSFNDRTEYPE